MGMNSNHQPTPIPDHALCPRCGKAPVVIRVGSYWKMCCPTDHLIPINGHTMKTKRAALAEWDKTYGAAALNK